MVKWKDSITWPQSIFYMVANKSNTRKEKKKSRKRNIFHSRHIWKRAETDVGRCRSKKKRMGGAKATEKLTSAYISYVRVILLSFWVTVCVYTRNVHCLLWCDPKGKHSSRKKRNLNKVFAVGRMMGRSLSHWRRLAVFFLLYPSEEQHSPSPLTRETTDMTSHMFVWRTQHEWHFSLASLFFFDVLDTSFCRRPST